MTTSPGASEASTRPRVIVAGYGPVGRVTAQKLEEGGAEVVIVDINLDTISRQLALDKEVHFGDISEEDTLRRVRVEDAVALVLTIPNDQCSIRACEVARRLNPAIYIAVRTSYVSMGMLASCKGADAVVVEEIVTAEVMSKLVSEHMDEVGRG